jgi:DNA-binding MarR family transcriptional regulator
VHQEDPSVEAWHEVVGAYRAVHALLTQELAKSSLTFPQYRVIRALGKFGAMPMNKLGEHMLVTPGNITGLIDRLERKGYIERVGLGTDRRVVTIKLTRKGEDSYQRTRIRHRKVVRRAMRGLSEEEKLSIARLLGKIKEAALAKEWHPK